MRDAELLAALTSEVEAQRQVVWNAWCKHDDTGQVILTMKQADHLHTCLENLHNVLSRLQKMNEEKQNERSNRYRR